MDLPEDREWATALRETVVPLRGADEDYDDLLDLLSEKQVVLLDAATRGTHEFHRERARITRRLVLERGFTCVRIEEDPAEAERIRRFVDGKSPFKKAKAALADLDSRAAWTWQTTEFCEFIEWLRVHNAICGTNRIAFSGALPEARYERPLDNRCKTVLWGHMEADALGEAKIEARHMVRIVFTTYSGSTLAVPSQGGAPRPIRLSKAPDGGYEALFHRSGIPRFLLPLGPRALRGLDAPRLVQRGQAASARQSGNVWGEPVLVSLPECYDFAIHIDETRSTTPFARSPDFGHRSAGLVAGF